MSFRAAFDTVAVTKAAQPDLHKIATEIGQKAARRMRFSRHQDPDAWVTEDLPDGRVRVGLTSSFGHLDEWGGARSRPSGALRSAAAEAGDFKPAPKP